MKDDDRDVATPDDIQEAIERLTDSDYLRLRAFARFRMNGLGGLARGRDDDDLFHEAVVATLDLRRTWRKGAVDFVYHLLKTMESTSDAWGRKKEAGERLETEMKPTDPEEDVGDLLGSLGPKMPDQERQAIASQELEMITTSLAGDMIALEVLSGMREDLTGPDIKAILGISEKELQSARRKIRRHAQTLFQPKRTRPALIKKG